MTPSSLIADAPASHTAEHLKPRLADPGAPLIAVAGAAGQMSA